MGVRRARADIIVKTLAQNEPLRLDALSVLSWSAHLAITQVAPQLSAR